MIFRIPRTALLWGLAMSFAQQNPQIIDTIAIQNLDEVVIADSRMPLKRSQSGRLIEKISSKEIEKFQGQDFVQFVGIDFLRPATCKISKNSILNSILLGQKSILYLIPINFCFDVAPNFRCLRSNVLVSLSNAKVGFEI